MTLRPTPEDYDDMHHALGRPKQYRAGDQTVRNSFCCAAGSPTADRFEELGWWVLRCKINDGRDAIYAVSGFGKQALEKWMRVDGEEAKR